MKVRPLARTAALVAVPLSLAAIALPIFSSTVGADDTPAVTPAVTPAIAGPFHQCPAIGADTTGCGFLISLPQTGSATVTPSGQGPYDGSDDTLIGVVNNTDQAISTVTLTSSSDIFAFDGDGICSSGFNSHWTNTCPYGTTGYEGPGTSFSNISGDKKSGTLDLFPALAPGASTFFSLESDLTGASFVIPAKFTVVKSVTSTGPYYAGSTSNPIDYSISATNDTGAQSGNINISDSVPTNTTLVTTPAPGCPPPVSGIGCTFTNTSNTTLSWAFTGVPGGATVTASFAVTPNDNAAPSVSNTAIWSGPGCLPAVEDAANSHVQTVTCRTNTTTTPVTPPPLVITASNTTSVYGTAGPAVTPTYTGLTGGDTQPTTPPTCTTVPPVTATTAVGTYTGVNKCSGAVDPKYTITYVNGNAAVTPAPLVITASSASVTPGAAAPTITASYKGFVNGDGATNLTTQPTCSTTYTATSAAGSYPSSCTGAADPNYSITYVPGTVTAAVVTSAATTTPSTPATTPATTPVTSPAIAFTGALLSQEWVVGAAAILFGMGLMVLARRRRRKPRHAAR